MRKPFVVLVAMAATASLAVGSGGFSSAGAERGVTVSVVGDENAYMSLSYADKTVSGDEAVTFVTVANRFTEKVEFTVDYDVETDDGVSVKPSSGSETNDVGVGGEFDVAVALNCHSAGQHDATVSFDVAATGDSVSVETSDSRQVTYRAMCNNGQANRGDQGRGNDDSEDDDHDEGQNDDDGQTEREPYLQATQQ